MILLGKLRRRYGATLPVDDGGEQTNGELHAGLPAEQK